MQNQTVGWRSGSRRGLNSGIQEIPEFKRLNTDKTMADDTPVTDAILTAVVAWRKRRRRTGVRASARVWRAVLLELGARGFEDLPADRVELQALVDRTKASLPPVKRGRKARTL
jgi:hypothetical protein